MRQLLNNQFGILDSLRQRIQGAAQRLNPFEDAYDATAFGDLDDDVPQVPTEQDREDRQADSTQQDHADSDGEIQASDEYFTAPGSNSDENETFPELRVLPIPSVMDQPLDQHQEIEMRLRVRQADALLTSLHELIADKSFHYSPVLRLTTHLLRKC